MNDTYLYVIIALLPLAACMVVFQVNPYHALVIRGILGAVAAMVYAILGAPDVALTEALVGTMLAITLYAVAVRSSLVMRLGLVKNEADEEQHFGQLIDDLRAIFRKRQMRLELVPYPNTQALERALMDKEVHATCVRRKQDDATSKDEKQFYHTAIRVKRIYEIMQTELTSPVAILSYVSTPAEEEKHKSTTPPTRRWGL
jgi:putative multicomponent Na+:H+ antiporter subunit B